jgi:hypothetical protein
MIAYLNGLSEIGKPKKSKAEKKATRKAKTEKLKTKVKEGIKKGVKVVGKVGLAPARAGFLLAVDKNVLKVAKRLAQAYAKHPEEIKKFWTNFGGDFASLKKAINKGAKANINGVHPSELGVVAETAIASATPIIIAIVKLFKSLKTDQAGDDTEDKTGINDLGTELLTGGEAKVVTKDAAGNEETLTDPDEKGLMSNKPLLIGGAVVLAAGAYFLLKKKK